MSKALLSLIGVTVTVPVALSVYPVFNFVSAPPYPNVNQPGIIQTIQKFDDIDVGLGQITYSLKAGFTATVHFTGDANQISLNSTRGTFSTFRLNNVPLTVCSDSAKINRSSDANSFRMVSCTNTSEMSLEGLNTLTPVYKSLTISANETQIVDLLNNETLTVILSNANKLSVRAISGNFNVFQKDGVKMTYFCTDTVHTGGMNGSSMLLRPCTENVRVELQGTYIEQVSQPRTFNIPIAPNPNRYYSTPIARSVPGVGAPLQQRQYYQPNEHVFSHRGVGW